MARNQNGALSSAPDGGVLRIDCDECRMQHTDACHDCIVSFICSQDEGAVVFDAAETRAMRSLVSVGLMPASRHDRRTG